MMRSLGLPANEPIDLLLSSKVNSIVENLCLKSALCHDCKQQYIINSRELKLYLISAEFLISFEQCNDVFDRGIGLDVVCSTENVATVAG